MKNTLLLSALSIALITSLKPEKAGAQITAVSISSGLDSLMSECVLPQTDNFYVYGTLTGTVPSVDSVTVYMNFDDGFDTTFKAPDYSYGGSAGGGFSIGYNHVYTIPGTYTPYVTITSSSGPSATHTDIAFTLSNTCATLTGKLYMDNNSNCIPDPGEAGVAWVPLMLVNTTSHDTTWGGWTDDTGYYAINMLPGSYEVIADPSVFGWWYWWGWGGSGITPSCPSSGTYSFTAAASTSYTENFGYACTPLDSMDVSAYGWNRCFVPGDTTWVEVWVGDWWWFWGYTCSTMSSTVTLSLDSKLTYVGYDTSWSAAPASVSGGTVTWNYSTTGDWFGFWALVKVVCSSTATLGDTLCNSVYATPTSLPDPNLANNTANFCGVVSSSYDPNGKTVSPQGTGTQGYIANNTPLSYEIHFQNTGTAPAANITINDTLSANLNASTLHIIKSSSPVEVYTSGNLVKFRFNNINLPDATANPVGSIGSISYAIMPKPDLAPGTQIWNKAGIYFDYNPPVVTNSTLNTINLVSTTGVQQVSNQYMSATVYPNPAGNEVFAKTDDKSDFTATITDVLGRTVASSRSANGLATLNTQSLPTGLYIVKLTNSSNKAITTKVTIQH